MWRSLGVGLIVVVLASCGDDPCDQPGPADACHTADPTALGMFPVGVSTFTVVDSARTDETGAARTFGVEVWYPATAASRQLPRDVYDLLTMAPAEFSEQLANVTIEPVAQDAARDAALDQRFAPYPVLTFSHGLAGIRFQNFNLAIYLASHGYVVIAPDHAGNTFWDFFDQLDLLADYTAASALLLASALDRPKDLVAAAEHVAANGGQLAGQLDLEQWGVLGHSFGGMTALNIVANHTKFFEPRVKASLPLAAPARIAEYLGGGADRHTVPMLMMGGRADRTVLFDDEQAYGYAAAPAPRGLVAVTDAGHYSFSDACVVDLGRIAEQVSPDLYAAVAQVINDGCGDTAPSQDSMRQVMGAYATAFFNRTVRNDKRSEKYLTPGGMPQAGMPALEYQQDGWTQ